MPLPFAGPLLSAGAGSTIPITGGTAGPATSGVSNTGAPINIGGLFGSNARSSEGNNTLIAAGVIGVAIVVAAVFFSRRR